MTLSNTQPCPHCGRYNNRAVSIDAVIIQSDKVLLIKRGKDPFKGHWALPGGFVEWDETTEDSVAREVLEETGLKVESCTLIGVYSSPKRHPQQVINVAYTVQATGQPRAGDDALEFQWCSINTLPELLAFDHREIILDALKKK
ncbi:MAG: NUDIX hydrolase [Bacteroidota bacterium]